ncbi:MAG: hypothetical protein KFF50_14285 [Desulfatitalea sp.]|nr:hypothetical protein [Desulfatitalea sp.]
MRIKLSDLEPFREICHKICLNIPAAYGWQWDAKRNMAVLVLEGEDAELVFFPLFKEFRHHWNFTSPPPENESVCQWISGQFGLMPGQVLFTSYPLCNLVLCVAWWPWGEDQKVSMRVGLIPACHAKLRDGVSFQCLSRWLQITPSS